MIRGRLSGALAKPGGDLDADGVEDALDTCPSHPNPAQSDADGNGVGDACQCGDLDADLRVGALDVAALRTYLAQPTLTPAAPGECEIAREGSEERCDLLDSVVLQRSIAGRASDGVQVCVPALL